VRELHSQGIAVQLVDIPEWHAARLPEPLRDPWFDSLQHECGSSVTLHFCMPHQAIPDRGKINVNYTMFEASRVHPTWIRYSRRHDLVVLPTESSRRAWLASGMRPDKLRLCPLGIDPALYSTSANAMDLNLPDGTSAGCYRARFLNVSEWGPRKNIGGLLGAWMKATTPKDNAVLILRLSRFGPLSDLFPFVVTGVERRIGKTRRDCAPVHFLGGTFSDGEMRCLYAAATHYISMSFGEGWDQPMLEAGASGLKLIAPEHSAYMAYLDSSVAVLIPSRPVPVRYVGDPRTARLFEGAEWWEPDEDRAAEYIRAEIDGRAPPRKLPRERILANFTWRQATLRLIEILNEAPQAKAKRWFFSMLR
jgi:glycosyltransferase involved in cell wall biosynthesis